MDDDTMITLPARDKLKVCCPEMWDGIARGTFIVQKDDNMVFSEGINLFYKALRFCPSCGKEAIIIRD